MRKSFWLGIALVLAIISMLSVTLAITQRMFSSVTSSSTWYGFGQGTITVLSAPSPRIVGVSIDKKSIEPGAWVEIKVWVTNDGPGTAPIQTIHIGLPFDPPSSDIQIVSTDLSEGAKIYPKGSLLGGPYGSITTKYPIVEGYHKNWGPGLTRTLTIKVKFPDTDTVAFDIKTVACDEKWNVLARDPKSGMLDQQGEYVRPYLVLRKFTVSVLTTGTVEVPVKIINHNRYVPSAAGTQPSIRVDTFDITDWGGFDKTKGSITATNKGLTIAPGSVGTLYIRITTSEHPAGTYTIGYTISGAP